MPKLTLSRIMPCPHPGCNSPGISEDGKCMQHSSCNDTNNPGNPDNFKNPMGLELEFYCSKDRYDLHGLANSIVGDGSLHRSIGRCYNGLEMRMINEAGKVGRIAGHVIRSLKTIAQVSVNETCGIHTHLSLNGLEDRELQFDRATKHSLIQAGLKNMEDEIYKVFPERTTRHTEYSAPISHGSHRYCWLTGYSNHPTVECRLHPGTTNPDTIIAWTKVSQRLQSLVTDVLNGKDNAKTRAAKRGRFFTQFQKGTVARHYIDYRLNELNNGSSAYEITENYVLPSV